MLYNLNLMLYNIIENVLELNVKMVYVEIHINKIINTVKFVYCQFMIPNIFTNDNNVLLQCYCKVLPNNFS